MAPPTIDRQGIDAIFSYPQAFLSRFPSRLRSTTFSIHRNLLCKTASVQPPSHAFLFFCLRLYIIYMSVQYKSIISSSSFSLTTLSPLPSLTSFSWRTISPGISRSPANILGFKSVHFHSVGPSLNNNLSWHFTGKLCCLFLWIYGTNNEKDQ